MNDCLWIAAYLNLKPAQSGSDCSGYWTMWICLVYLIGCLKEAVEVLHYFLRYGSLEYFLR